jgi:hypothetical protein
MKEEKKNINLHPPSPSRVKEIFKKSRHSPSRSTINKQNKTIQLAPFNSKK